MTRAPSTTTIAGGVASGQRTKSELSGVGEEEFAPWIIGLVM